MTSARGNAASVPTPPKLDPPPRLARGALRVVALGGITEIGRNMTVYEFDGRLLIVDCGVLFPEEHQPGVDLSCRICGWSRIGSTTSRPW